MGMFSNLFPWAKKQTGPPDEEIEAIRTNIALKNMALEKCVNYVARRFSKVRFLVKGSHPHHDWEYLLNVKPNQNQTAPTFWAEVIKTLLIDGEVLIVVEPSLGLFVADSFTRERHMSGDLFRVSTVQGQSFDKEYAADDVIFIENENDSLRSFTEELWKDYGNLIARLIDNQLTVGQIRYTIKLPKDKLKERATEISDGELKPKNNNATFIKRLSNRIRTDKVVPIPVSADSDYEEHSNKATTRISYVDDLKKAKEQYTDEVAEYLGIPNSLIHGEVADNERNDALFIVNVIDSLVRKIESALENAVFTREESISGARIKTIGYKNYDPFKIASHADKIIASGNMCNDEVREELGLPPLPNGLGQIFYMTKNYANLEEKGGEENEEVTD